MSLAACVTTPPPPTSSPPFVLGERQTKALVLTRVASPWWAPDFLITGKFVDSIPEYAAVPALEHKAYTLSEDRRFGGLYLWPDRASAERFFDEAWHARVRKARGVDGDVQILDALWTVQGDAPSGTTLPHHGLRTEGAVTWLWAQASDGVTARLEALARLHGVPAGVVRVSLVTSPGGGVGLVALWNSRARARAFWTQARLDEARTALGADAQLTWFRAPVFLDVAADRASRAPGSLITTPGSLGLAADGGSSATAAAGARTNEAPR
ncbi:MAG: hypothetical protein SFW67_00360 [Myxococcaceae bacterium]|nr:hypothetical protein [Myxococcaceae bacterium]